GAAAPPPGGRDGAGGERVRHHRCRRRSSTGGPGRSARNDRTPHDSPPPRCRGGVRIDEHRRGAQDQRDGQRADVGRQYGCTRRSLRGELTMPRQRAITPAGGWQLQLVEVGSGRHPGSWVGPTYPEWYWSPINVLLLESGSDVVLVDCGAGVAGSWWPFEGFRSDTETALAHAGVSPGDVALVVLTHLDYDHAGGLLQGAWPDDLRLAFPQANVVAH